MPQFYLISEEALAEVTSNPQGNLEGTLAKAATKTVKKEDLRPYVEGYLGILDDHDCDLTDYASDALQEALEEACEDGNAAWIAIPAAQAEKLTALLSKIRITGDNVEDYFGDEDDLEDVQLLHDAFRKVLGDLPDGQVLVFRGDSV
jgi:hypothetical protein